MASGFILLSSRIDDQLGRGAMHNWQVGKIWKQKQPPLIIFGRTHTFASRKSYKGKDKMTCQTTQDLRAKKSDSADRLYIEARPQHRGEEPTPTHATLTRTHTATHERNTHADTQACMHTPHDQHTLSRSSAQPTRACTHIRP